MARAQQTNAKRSHERIEGSSHPRVPALRRAIRRSGELERQIALRRFGDSASSSGHVLKNSPVVPEPDSGPVCSWPGPRGPASRQESEPPAPMQPGPGRLCVPLRAGARVLECLRCARAPPRLCPRAVRKALTAGWLVCKHRRPERFVRRHGSLPYTPETTGPSPAHRRESPKRGPVRVTPARVTYRGHVLPGPRKEPTGKARPHGETAPRSRRLSRRNRCPGLASCSALLSLRRRTSHGMKLGKKASKQRPSQ